MEVKILWRCKHSIINERYQLDPAATATSSITAASEC